MVIDSVGDQDGQLQGSGGGPTRISGEYVGGREIEADGDQYVETTDWADAGFDLNEDFAIAYTIESDDNSADTTVLGARE